MARRNTGVASRAWQPYAGHVRYRISHRTSYHYEQAVEFTDHRLYLRPREDHHLRVVKFQLVTMPAATFRWVRDAYENLIAIAKIPGRSKQLVVMLDIELDLPPINPYDFLLDSEAVSFPFTYKPTDRLALSPYVTDSSPLHPRLDAWLQSVMKNTAGRDTVPVLSGLNTAVHQTLQYHVRYEPDIQSPQETLRLGTGCCRDYAMLLMASVRALGLAARYVSGYCHTGDANGPGHADNSMHAWVEIYLPGAGWKGFDPTNGVLANDAFIPVAVSAEPDDVAPIQGSYCNTTPVRNTMDTGLTITKNP